MLRISGIIALLVSSLAAIVLFASVRTLRLAGTIDSSEAPSTWIELDSGPGSTILKSFEAPYSFPASTGSNDAHRVLTLFFDGELDPPGKLEEGDRVVVLHRWIGVRRLHWAFGCTEIDHSGRIYVVDRPRSSFFGVLGLISAAPVLLWTLAAVPGLLFRRRSPRPEGTG